MKRKIIVPVVALALLVALALTLAACSGGSDDTYYEVKGYGASATLDESSWVKLKGGKWTDNDGESGTYKLDGDKITILQDGEEWMSGTLKDGTLELEMWGIPAGTYRTKSAADNSNPDSSAPVEPSEARREDCVVTFDANGGALRSDRTIMIKKGDRISKPIDPTYSEHVFLGWSKSVTKETLWDFAYDTVSGDITLYACWENEIVVSFNANGGQFSDDEKVKNVKVNKGSKISKPDEPTRDNYTFTNWFADSKLTARWDFNNDSVVASVTLYAGWAYDEKDITFVLNYTGAKDVVRKTIDGMIDYTPERGGYVFNGWWLSSGKTSDGYILSKKYDTTKVVTQNGLTLYAEWVDEATMASQLTAPSVGIEDGVFSWEAIPGAQGYGIVITKSGSTAELDRKTVNGTSWSFPEYSYDPGYYSVKIRANGDGINAVNSVYVTKSYANKILPSVTGISLDISTSVLTWAALSYSATYNIYLNNQLEITTSDTVFDMSNYDAGSYNLKIEAQYRDYTKSVSTKSIIKYRLKSPVFQYSIKKDGTYHFTWDSAVGADTYIITINDQEYRTSNQLYDFSPSMWGEATAIVVNIAACDSEADYLISVNNQTETIKDRPYVIQTVIDDEQGGKITAPLYAFQDSEVTLIAETNIGYTWVGWFEGETKVSDGIGLTYTFTMPAEIKTYMAKFDLCAVHAPDENCVCTKCGATAHTLENCVCIKCGAEDHSANIETSGYCRHENYIYFGAYPQTKVTDSPITNALNSLAGTLPISSDSQAWTSYEYYEDGLISNYMWYIDLEYSGEKYRGVYFTQYRPYYTSSSSSANNSYQDDNGYNTSTVYWFKYEPIKWRILSEEDGEALILSEMIIDSQEYYSASNASSFSHNGGTGYANNYALSNIRKWLNDTFYNTAFTDLQKLLIVLTTVDNSARSTNPNNNATEYNSGNNSYACENTQDYIFCLSEQEVTNSAYGFDSSYSADDAVRQKKNTDYAKSQGAWTSTSSEYLGDGFWGLRSPRYSNSRYVLLVNNGGRREGFEYVNSANIGIVPALKIKLD